MPRQKYEPPINFTIQNVQTVQKEKNRDLSLSPSLSAIHSPFKVNESSWTMGYWIDPILRLSLRVVEWFITNNNKILVILLKDKYSKNNQKVT